MEDYLITGTIFNNTVEVVAVETTNISKVASKFHKLSKGSNIMLAKTMTASLLMSAFMKNENENLTLSIDGNGKFGKIISVVNSQLDVRGCIQNTNIVLCEDLNAGNDGYIKIVRDIGFKEPYVGVTNLVTGNIEDDLEYYYSHSEQITSYFVIEETLEDEVKRIGGILVQILPGASDDTIKYLKQNRSRLKMFKDLLLKGYTLEEIIIYIFKEIKLKSNRRCQYKCNCSREKMERGFMSLGKDEILKIMKEDGKASLECHFCGKRYVLSNEELKSIINDF